MDRPWSKRLVSRIFPIVAPAILLAAVLQAQVAIPSPQSGREVAPTETAPASGTAPTGADPCAKVEKGKPVVPAEQKLDLRFIPVVPETQQRFDSRDWEFEVPQPLPKGRSSYHAPESMQVGPTAPIPSPLLTFAGLGFSDSCTGGGCGAGWPPDTNGDVGPNHYVQSVNTAFAVYDKTGTRLAATTFNSLWSGAGTGTPCDHLHQGDPVVIYDPMGDRWIVTDFAFALTGNPSTPLAPCYECIAVSKTADPVSGGWYLYAIDQTKPPGAGSADLLNDYPKFGIWPDGLYQSSNMFMLTAPGGYWGTAFWAYNRLDMEAGKPITPVVASIPGASTTFTLLPSNLRIGPQGAFPPGGTPAYLVGASKSVWAFEVRKFAVNWGAGTGTISVPTNVSYASWTAPESPAQLGSPYALDSLDWRAMVQAQYRTIGGVESLWINHTVRNGASVSDGIQWSQIDVTGGTIATSPVQTQIYAPDTTLDRWLGSLAVDGQGNMALGYSTSNSATYPSLKYAGRLVGDALNTLPQTETTLYAGTGSQNFTLGGDPVYRWGDYSAMSVDPKDDCTFWYTNEYYQTTGSNWQTRVGAFKFPSCTLSSGTLAVTAQDCFGLGIKNAVVTIDGHDYGVTPASGVFNAYLSPGSHSVQASFSGNSSSAAVSVPGSVTLTVGNTAPTAFSVTGGGSYCFGGAGVAVGLAGSEIGASYQLFNGVIPVGSPVTGTGSALNFGSQTAAGIYTATGSNLCGTTAMTGSATVIINPLPVITPTSVPPAIFGKKYCQQLTASGCMGSCTFTILTGSLPPGLTMDSTGYISGIPTVHGGTYNFTVRATNSGGCYGDQAYTTKMFDLIFVDDYGRSRFYVDSTTGTYEWDILKGMGLGVYTGVLQVLNSKTLFKSFAVDTNVIYITYDPYYFRAKGYLSRGFIYSPLSDLNTQNNVPACP